MENALVTIIKYWKLFEVNCRAYRVILRIREKTSSCFYGFIACKEENRYLHETKHILRHFVINVLINVILI